MPLYATALTPDLPSAPILCQILRQRLGGFLWPLLAILDQQMDVRLVRTLAATVETVLVFRHRAYGLLLSELGDFLLDPRLEGLVESVLRLGCHRTGKRSRETQAPLYRLRAAISRLWLAVPSLPAHLATGNLG